MASHTVTPLHSAAPHSAAAVVTLPRQGANIDLSLFCVPPRLLPQLAAPGVSRWADTGCGRLAARAGHMGMWQPVSASGGVTLLPRQQVSSHGCSQSVKCNSATATAASDGPAMNLRTRGSGRVCSRRSGCSPCWL